MPSHDKRLTVQKLAMRLIREPDSRMARQVYVPADQGRNGNRAALCGEIPNEPRITRHRHGGGGRIPAQQLLGIQVGIGQGDNSPLDSGRQHQQALGPDLVKHWPTDR